MVWICSIAAFFTFLYHVPMAVFLRAAYDGYAGGWASVGFVLHPIAVERTVYISRFPRRAKKVDIGFRAVMRVFHGLWQKKNTSMHVKARIGPGDAAAAALICGWLWALTGALSDRVKMEFIPEYGAQDAHFALRGMLWAKTGHIAMAAFAYWREKRRKENGEKAH